MASLAWNNVWQPRTLTDRRNDITTIKSQRSAAGLVPADVAGETPGTIDLVVESGGGVRRVRFAIPSVPGPTWLTPTIARVGKLLSIPHRCDRRGDSPVDATSIQSAMDALTLVMSQNSSLAQWTPTQRSGVQLDWHENGIDLEIAFEPGENEGYAVFNDRDCPRSNWDGPLSDHLITLRAVFQERLTS